MRPTTCQKVSDLATEGDVVFDDLVPSTEELAQGNDFWRRQLQALKAVAIGTQRLGKHKGVAPVVLGATHGIAVAESVDLFGIDGENGDTTLEKGFDHGAMRFLDRHRDALDIFSGEVQEPVECGCKSYGTMLEA